ncbi:aminoacyl--tRNA ligase-related protein [Salipiger sp. 1_MG-2023]|uniref:aminoacyl--tRNA ligase-related protein n=1 Tax=Salipiger sp. 1_MG-2023 TaxID=3062665 RepID=UPI0034C6414A
MSRSISPTSWIARCGKPRGIGRTTGRTCSSRKPRMIGDDALKPMNCPGHMLIYGQGSKSYRDLPLEIAESGKVYRYEPSAGGGHGDRRSG